MNARFPVNDNFIRIVELTPILRKQIEATVEQLVAILDQFDGDTDREDDGCGEPWLGFTENAGRGVENLNGDGISGDDREFAEDDRGEPEESDDNHGWFEHINQADSNSFWSAKLSVE